MVTLDFYVSCMGLHVSDDVKHMDDGSATLPNRTCFRQQVAFCLTGVGTLDILYSRCVCLFSLWKVMLLYYRVCGLDIWQA